MPTNPPVTVLARMIAQFPRLTDDLVVAQLRAAGVDEKTAELAIALIPVAFARALFKRMSSAAELHFSDEVELGMPEANRPRSTLSAFPLFCEASALAGQLRESGLFTSAEIIAIAGRSSEFHLINHLVLTKQAIKDLHFAPLRLPRL